MLQKLQDNRNALGLLFMLPAAVLLVLFLTYPLGLGTWLGFTDAKIGRTGEWIGLDNYEFLWNDSVTRLALFNTIFYTVVASILKFVLGLYLAILLNRNIRVKTFFRAVILLPYIVPTALSAIAFWWIYDAQFSIISWVLTKMGLIHNYIDFLGVPWNARLSTIAANVWRGVPFVAITLLAGLQTISPSYYEASAIDGATPWQQFRHLAAADPDHRGGDDVLGAVHVHRLPTDLRDHARRPAQCDAPDGDAVVPARDPRRRARRRRRDLDRDGAVPAGGDPVQLFRAAAAQVAAGRGRLMREVH
jgi:ABC-type spermidine/putrescine transport system permease subunit II